MIMVRVDGNYYQSDNKYRKMLERWILDDYIGGVITFTGSIHGTFYNIQRFQSLSNMTGKRHALSPFLFLY